jgi:hypothetical protein
MTIDLTRTHKLTELLSYNCLVRSDSSFSTIKNFNFNNYRDEVTEAVKNWRYQYAEIALTNSFIEYTKYLSSNLANLKNTTLLRLENINYLFPFIKDNQNEQYSTFNKIISFQLENIESIIYKIESDLEARGIKEETKFSSEKCIRIHFKLSQVDLLSLFWLLRKAKFIEYVPDTQLLKFMHGHLNFERAGISREVSKASNSFAKLENHEIGNFQKEDLIELRAILDSMNEILQRLQETVPDKPEKRSLS